MNTALILSGGVGKRLGMDIPKQYIEVCGKPIITYCVETLAAHSLIQNIQIVADYQWHDFISGFIHTEKFRGFSKPGINRQLSIYNGLTDILKYASQDDYVLIHDAARPMLSDSLITECLKALKNHDGALPVLPMKDTVYFSENGKNISSLVDRNKIYAGQAPEAFVLGKYYESNKDLLPDDILKINGSTEPAIMAGMDIALIQGDEQNFKITTKADLERFKEIIG